MASFTHFLLSFQEDPVQLSQWDSLSINLLLRSETPLRVSVNRPLEFSDLRSTSILMAPGMSHFVKLIQVKRLAGEKVKV